MKNFLFKTFLLLLVTIQSTAWALNIADKALPKEGAITRDNINIRADSTVYSPSLVKLKKGDRVKILKEHFNWYKIIPPKNTIKGFIYAEYIKKDKQGNYICAADNLNIRIKPNLSSKIIGTLKRNTPLKVIGKTKDFFMIDPYPFAYAWVHKKFVEPIKPIQIEITTTPEEKPQETPPETEGTKTSAPPLDTEKGSTPGQIIHKEGKLLKRFFSKNPCGLVYYLKGPKQEKIYLNIPEILTSDIKLFLRKNVIITGEMKENSAKGCRYIQVKKITVK